jgi:hypothetical protein
MRANGKVSAVAALLIQGVGSSCSGRTVGALVSPGEMPVQYRQTARCPLSQTILIQHPRSSWFITPYISFESQRGVIKWHKQIPAVSPCYSTTLTNCIHWLININKALFSYVIFLTLRLHRTSKSEILRQVSCSQMLSPLSVGNQVSRPNNTNMLQFHDKCSQK